MLNSEIENHLLAHGIKPTANRMMVAQAIAAADHPVCLAELEDTLDTVDKSNIFRALTLFRESHIVHTIEDEAGALRYEMCHGHFHNNCGCDTHPSDMDDDEDLHAHFYCRVCHRMTCLQSIAIPSVSLPEGYEAMSATFIIKGVCPKCKSNSIPIL